MYDRNTTSKEIFVMINIYKYNLNIPDENYF